MKRLILILLDIPITGTFTPLESPSIYAAMAEIESLSCTGKVGGKSSPFHAGLHPCIPAGFIKREGEFPFYKRGLHKTRSDFFVRRTI
jgi:hypothetical protein